MRQLMMCLMLAALGIVSEAAEDAPMIVKDGKPNAQIVIAAENRPRMATLAALELQWGIEKISGARLPIVTNGNPDIPVKIFVGKSPETEKLGVKSDDLKYGAYRMVSGPDWIVLLGNDIDFDCDKSPLPKDRKDTGVVAVWDKAVKERGKTDTAWRYPFGGAREIFWNPRTFEGIISERYGKGSFDLWMSGGNTVKGFWACDENGSLNAVCAFLRNLGVRWYMPGEIGEVLPKTASISAGPFNETVIPDYPLRSWTYYNYSSFGFDDLIWARRIGMNLGLEYLGLHRGPHGLVGVYSSEAMRKDHPEYYALIGGVRDIEHRNHGTPCFSSKGLENETVNYIRFMYDEYGFPSIDIWPGDGLKLCECEECKGKTASELVWGFADRVAREVYKTHPNKRVTCGAYTSYVEAPDTIAKFSPNLSVWIANAGRPSFVDPGQWNEYWDRVQKWQSKLAPGNILRLENNRYHVAGIDDAKSEAAGKRVRGLPISYPVIHPHAVARDLHALKGISGGDSGEQSQFGGKWKVIGLEHITLYVQSRFLWDADLDVDQVLDEYFTTFYGPAAKEMKEAIDFAEKNMAIKDESKSRGRGNPMNVSLKTALQLRDLLDKSKAAAGDSIYGQRVQTVISCLQPRDELIAKYKKTEASLVAQRAKAPLALGVAGTDLSKAVEYELKDGKTGKAAEPLTTFKVGWTGKALLLDIVCKEPDMKALKVDDAVNTGDYLVVSIETPVHSYYHMEINPDGKLIEGNPNPGWKSLAELRTERGADFWRIQMSIPVVGDKEAEADPNHRVAGAKPTSDSLWYFNVGRKRTAVLVQPEIQEFSPTGGRWHVPGQFGRLEIK